MFHTLKTMTAILLDAGLTTVDVLPSPISGGSWVLFAAQTSAKAEPTDRWNEALEAEETSGVWETSDWQEFAIRVGGHRQTLAREVAKKSDAGQIVVAYGPQHGVQPSSTHVVFQVNTSPASPMAICESKVYSGQEHGSQSRPTRAAQTLHAGIAPTMHYDREILFGSLSDQVHE